MKCTKEELIKQVTEAFEDSTTDEALALIENITDTITDDNEDWHKKYIDNDKSWREKYRNRFMGCEETTTETQTEENETDNKPLTFENLFKE